MIAQAVEPTSLLDAGRVLRDLGSGRCQLRDDEANPGRAATGKYRNRMRPGAMSMPAPTGTSPWCATTSPHCGFGAERRRTAEGWLFQQRRVDPKIVLGLLVDAGGFPLEIGFKANKQKLPPPSFPTSSSASTPGPGRRSLSQTRRMLSVATADGTRRIRASLWALE